MTILTGLISDYGWPAVAGAAVLYVLLRSEIRIYYPGRSRKGLQSPVARRDYPLSTYAGSAIFSLSPTKIPCKLFELGRSS
jgi:hypothetical protein